MEPEPQPELSRRGFLGMLGGATAALVLDPEKALWVPNKKLISIPNTQPLDFFDALAEEHLRGLHALWIQEEALLTGTINTIIYPDLRAPMVFEFMKSP